MSVPTSTAGPPPPPGRAQGAVRAAVRAHGGLRADLACEQTKETPPPSRRRQAGPKLRCAPAGLGQEGGAEIWEGGGEIHRSSPRKSGPRGKEGQLGVPGPRPPRTDPLPSPLPTRHPHPRALLAPCPPAACAALRCAAPSPGSPCAFWKRLPGCTGARGRGRRETSPTCWRASPRWPPAAGCASARGCDDVCACVCAPPPGRRGRSSVPCASFSLGPHTPPPEAARGSQVAAWPRRSWSPPLPIRAPLTRRERERGRSPRRRRPRSGGGNRARAPCGGPRAGSRAVVLNGQLRALQPGAQPPPQDSEDVLGRRHSVPRAPPSSARS